MQRRGRTLDILDFVEVDDFIDNRNPAPYEQLPEPVEAPEIIASGGGLDITIPESLPTPSLGLYADCPTPYHIELWAEKSTVDDILRPLADDYGLNIQTALGEISAVRCRHLVARAAGNGDRPVRILYISDFDPAGMSRPVGAARKIEFLLQELVADYPNVQLHPVVLTHEQCVRYRLPRTPIKESEGRGGAFEERFGEGATELDALEALHPGTLREILVAEIERFLDPDFASEWEDAVSEADDRLSEIAADATSRLAGTRDALQARLDALRASAEAFAADFAAYSREVESELEAAAPDVDEFDLPEPREPDEWEDPLFDSDRDYVEQNDRYKRHQGKRTEARPGRWAKSKDKLKETKEFLDEQLDSTRPQRGSTAICHRHCAA